MLFFSWDTHLGVPEIVEHCISVVYKITNRKVSKSGHRRANCVILTHEILSWHKDDAKDISLGKLEDMATQGIILGSVRLNRLGFTDDRLMDLDKTIKQTQELCGMREKTKEKTINRRR